MSDAEIVTEADQIIADLRSLRAGRSFVYWHGFLAKDISTSPAAAFVRREALGLQEAGRVALTQRRVAEGIYDYIATAKGSR